MANKQVFGFSASRAIHAYVRDNADVLFITTTAPASYSAASNQPQKVISANVTAGDWTLSSGSIGPRLAFGARTLTVEGSGSASHAVWARVSGSTVLMVTDVCGAPIASGNSVSFAAWYTELDTGADLPIYPANATTGVVGAAAELFTIPMLDNIFAWYAPESTHTVTANVINQWNDRTANANHMAQAAVGFMPAYISAAANGFNVARFSGSNNGLFASAANSQINTSAQRAFSVALVARASTLAVAGAYMLSIGNIFNNNSSIQIGASTNSMYVRSLNSAGATQPTSELTGMGATAYRVIRVVKASSIGSVYLDGALVCAAVPTSAATDFDVTRITMGASPLVNGNFFTGDIAEVVITATAMASSHGRELDKLLGAKYGITIT